MCNMLLLYICFAGIASASTLSEVDNTSQYSPDTAVTPESFQSHSSESIPYSLTPSIKTYSTVPQLNDDIVPISHPIAASQIRCKCHKKKNDTEVKFGAHSVPQTGGIISVAIQPETVPAVGTSTPAPIDGSSATYIASPAYSETQETYPGYNGYDTSANKFIIAPTAATYFTNSQGVKNIPGQRESTAVANTNLYPGTPSIQYHPNPPPIAISPSSPSAFPRPTNYHKSIVGPHFSNYNSPYGVNPYDPRLPYSPINPVTYNVNSALPYAVAGQNVAIPGGPNPGFIIHSGAPGGQPNIQNPANSPITYVPQSVSSTPKPIIFSSTTPTPNVVPHVTGPHGSYINNAAHYSTATVSPRPIITYSGAPAVSPLPNQFSHSAVYDNHAPNVQNYGIPGNPAFSFSSPPAVAAFARPVSYSNGLRSLSERPVAVPVVQHYGSVVPGASTYAAQVKSGRIYSSAPEVSRVHFNGGGISYSW